MTKNWLQGVWAGPSYGQVSVEEDLAYVRDVLADLNNTMCVDPNRVYATGHSNGAGFLGSIACSSTSDYFAAFAPASGSFYTDNSPDSLCTPARLPVPMLEFHGGADTSVNYTGGQGEGGVEPAIPDWLSWWARRNGCAAENSQVDTFNGDVHWRTWNCSGKSNLLQHYKVDDMGE
jgi:poly(3-hydroxybutyrate) depolymerase